jgi:replicative DNA helicase
VTLAETKWPAESADIKPGFTFLQNHIGGYVPGDVLVVGGATNVGKSHLALALLASMADAGVPGLYVSLEDPKVRVSRRLAHGYARSNLYTAFPEEPTCGAVLRTMRLAAERGVRAFACDYIQEIDWDGTTPAWGEADAVRRCLGAIEREAARLGGMAIVVSQVNRPSVDTDPDAMPRLSRLAGSSAIEKKADFVLFLANVKGRPVVGLAKAKDARVPMTWSLVRDERTGVLREPMTAPADSEGKRGRDEQEAAEDDDW